MKPLISGELRDNMRSHEIMVTDNDPRTSLKEFWLIILKRRLTVLSFLFGVLFLGALVSFLKTPVFTARGTLWIEAEPVVLPVQDILQLETRTLDYYQSQYRLLRSRALAGETIDRHKLWSNPHFAGPARKGGALRDAPDPLFREILINRLLDKISVDPIRETRMAEVGFSDPDPRFAADTLNAFFDAYVDMNIRRRYEASEQAAAFLREQIITTQAEMEAGEKKLQEYGAQKNIVPLSETETTIVDKLGEINRALTEATITRINAESNYNEIRSAAASDNPVGLDNALIQRLREDYARLRREYARKLETLGPEYPEMQRLKTEMDTAGQSLRAETQNLISAAASDYQAALKREQALRELFEVQKQEAFKLNSDSILYGSLKSEVANKKNLLDQLLKRQSEADVFARLKGVGSSNIWIVDRAAVPLWPSSPKKKLNMILALVFGLSGGIGLALLFENLNDNIRTSKDVSKFAALPTLGAIPPVYQGPGDKRARLLAGLKKKTGFSRTGVFGRMGRPLSPDKKDNASHSPLAARGRRRSPIELITLHQPQSIQSECYRSILTSLQVSYAPGKIKSILFTSPLAAEGKSTALANLAVMLSHSGSRVVIIDTDLRRPRQARIFNEPSGVGLTNFLGSEMDINELVKSTAMPNLWIITSGPVPTNPVDLLSSPKLDKLIASLRQSFDFVFFDSPPVLVVSDAIAMGPLTDGIILVAWAGRTPVRALKQAKQKLDAHRLKCLGVILNDVDLVEQDGYYAREYYTYYRNGRF